MISVKNKLLSNASTAVLMVAGVYLQAAGQKSVANDKADRRASRTIFSFEAGSKGNAERFHTERSEAFFGEKGVTDGIHSLEVHFQALGNPTITFLPRDGQTAIERGQADTLLIDLTNPEENKQEIKIAIEDTGRKRETFTFEIPGKARSVVGVPLNGFSCPHDFGMKVCPGEGLEWMEGSTATFDVERIASISLFMPEPDRPHIMMIDNIRLSRLSQYETDRVRAISDKFGQLSTREWPGKVHSEAELRESAKRELEDGAALWPKNWDIYGGASDQSGAQKTGFFHLERIDGSWWLIDPIGHRFFSTAVDGVRWVNSATSTVVTGRTPLFAAIPNEQAADLSGFFGKSTSGLATFDFYHYNVARKYGSDARAKWTNVTLGRLHKWRFNTIETPTEEFFGRSVPYELRPSITGAFQTIAMEPHKILPDPFDPIFAVAARKSLAIAAEGHEKDPWLVGYFVDNELGWGRGSHARAEQQYALVYKVFSLEGQTPVRQAFVSELQNRYKSPLELNKVWGTRIASWDELLSKPIALPHSPSAEADEDLSRLLTLFADKYFSIVKSAVRAADSNHLYLGVRFAGIQRAPFEVVQSCAKYCDIVSFNIYLSSVEPSLWQNTGAAGHPALISEFHFGSPDRGLFGSGEGPVVSEEERAKHYAQYSESVASNPDFVGYNWFIYADQPLTGADYPGNAENSHVGLVSVVDREWEILTKAATRANELVYGLHSHSARQLNRGSSSDPLK